MTDVLVPETVGARSDLDGIRLVAISTDADANLANLKARTDLTILAEIPYRFRGVRAGYLVVVEGP